MSNSSSNEFVCEELFCAVRNDRILFSSVIKKEETCDYCNNLQTKSNSVTADYVLSDSGE